MPLLFQSLQSLSKIPHKVCLSIVPSSGNETATEKIVKAPEKGTKETVHPKTLWIYLFIRKHRQVINAQVIKSISD